MYGVFSLLFVLFLFGAIVPFIPGLGRGGSFVLSMLFVGLATAAGPAHDDQPGAAATAKLSEAEVRDMAAKVGLKYTPDTPGIDITQAEYGSRWPYYAGTKAKLRCTRGVEPGTGMRPIATVEVNGFIFGLNGAAMGIGGYMSDREIRRTNEWGTPVAGPFGSDGFLERALTICGE